MNKVVRDGKVAVLYSPGYGGGWVTEGLPREAAFHPELVKLVEENRHSEITRELLKELFGGESYVGEIDTLEICWVPEGTDFYITEYDGYEKVVTKENPNWFSV